MLRRLIRLATRPFDRFLRLEAKSSILLLAATALALIWANSPFASLYDRFWHTPFGIHLGTFRFERSLQWFVNDGLMVLFFFVVGMEIRREVQHGELSDWRRAALPFVAAFGGMVVPAVIYLLFAGAPTTRSGWGIPMATDIAFAVGILMLLGKRVPPALRVLLLAVAVIDDLGAIIVIAVFYSAGLAASGLVIAALGFGGILLMQRFDVRKKLAYVAPSLVAWMGIYASGIHPTIAGVIVGLLTPATKASHEPMSPSDSLIETLHPFVAYGIMPVFALANAGVAVLGGIPGDVSNTVTTAVAAGLFVGKPIGVFTASWITLRLGIGTLPVGLGLRHLVVLGVVAGVGFTMALFVAQLAFADANLLTAAKLGILAASAIAAVVALVLGRLLLRHPNSGD